MGQNKNFIAARLPQELYDRLESAAGDKKGEKTQIIIRAIAAYLDFPLKSTDVVADNDERFIALENRIAQLEQQLQEFKKVVINRNPTDNVAKIPVIASDNNSSPKDNSNRINTTTDNKSAVLVQGDGRIGPAPESLIAEFMGIKRSILTYYRKTLKETGKPFNQPKRVNYNDTSYDLICQGESKSRGKTVFLWVAVPVINDDNIVYQPDITGYHVDSNPIDTLQELNQEEQRQGSESLQLSDNVCYQELSEQPNPDEALSKEQQSPDEQSTAKQEPKSPEEEQPEF